MAMVIAGTLSTRLIGHSTPASSAAATTAVGRSFAPVQDQNLIVSRYTELRGPQGQTLHVALHLVNNSTAVVNESYDEVIAKSMASSLTPVHFSPPTPSVIRADPVVRYAITKLPIGGSRDLSYDIDVSPEGANQGRLASWARDEADAQAAYLGHAPVSLAAVTVSPNALALAAGATATLHVSGVMTDGSAASVNALTGGVWTTADPAVARVSGGTVTGVGPGTTDVTVTVGPAHAAAAVAVGAAGAPLPAVPSPPPVIVNPALPTDGPSSGPVPLPTAAPAPTTQPTAVPTEPPTVAPAPTPIPWQPLDGNGHAVSFSDAGTDGWYRGNFASTGNNVVRCDMGPTVEQSPCLLEFNNSKVLGSEGVNVTHTTATGQRIRFDVWIRCNSCGTASADVSLWGVGGNPDKGDTNVSVTTTWQMVTVIMTATNGHTSLRGEIYMGSPGVNYDIAGDAFYGPQ